MLTVEGVTLERSFDQDKERGRGRPGAAAKDNAPQGEIVASMGRHHTALCAAPVARCSV